MNSSKNNLSFSLILGSAGLILGIVTNIAYFQQGGRVSLISLGLYPVLGFVLGGWIDGKRSSD